MNRIICDNCKEATTTYSDFEVENWLSVQISAQKNKKDKFSIYSDVYRRVVDLCPACQKSRQVDPTSMEYIKKKLNAEGELMTCFLNLIDQAIEDAEDK